MNVSGATGVPASLPLPTPPPVPVHDAIPGATAGAATTAGSTAVAGSSASSAGSTANSAGSGTGTGATGSVGELHIPGSKPTSKHASEIKAETEAPKPAALPPLKGLTVAEIRAMLGVAALPRLSDGATPVSPSTPGTAAVQAATLQQRYA
jgi:hypothetical protein